MNILGINWGEHDSAACLIQDGRLIAAAEEERFNRIKHAPFAYPLRAAHYCLQEGKIEPEDVDIIAFSFSPTVGLGSGIWHALRHFPRGNFIALSELVRRAWYIAQPGYSRYVLKLPAETRSVFVPHHMAHAASAFYASPFDRAAVLIVDAMGEWPTTSLYQGVGNRLEPLLTINFPHSLGFYYSAFTEYFGFSPFEGEYKVMGMAAYGQPRFDEQLGKLLRLSDAGRFQLDLQYFNFQYDYGRTTWYSTRMEEAFGPPATSTSMPDQHYLDLAASVQQRLEDAIFHLVDHLHERTGLPNLCLAGGVALNSVANGKLVRRGPFERLFVQPAAADSGTALGAALYAQHHVLGKKEREPLQHVFLGPEYTSEEIRDSLKHSLLDYEEVENPAEVGAELLAQGHIVGWFQGRMEFGPRALGNRSILADPRRAEMKDRINAAVKFRESFRPFAPSVAEERSDEFFEDVGGSPYMLRVTPVRPGVGERIPAVTHVNGSARLHTVSLQTNPLYHELIERFGSKTGVPVVLNTSFNVRGEPIVCTPKEAVACFFNSGLDALVLDRFLLRKSIS